MSGAGQQYPWQTDPAGYLKSILGPQAVITSGFRTPAQNAAAHGAPDSMHLTGQALDFREPGETLAGLKAQLQKSGFPATEVLQEIGGVPTTQPVFHVGWAPKGGAASQPAPQAGDPIDAMLAQRASAPTPAAPPSPPVMTAATAQKPDAVDALLAQQAAAHAAAPPPPAAPQQAAPVSTLADLAKTIPSKLAQGTTSLIGMGGDVLNFLEGSNPSATYNAVRALKGEAPISMPAASTAQSLDKVVSAPFGGYYQPQTTAGKYVGSVAEYAPSAVLGPEGLVPKIASVVGPALVSEGMGQVASGTRAEPVARLVGSLVGGGLGGAAVGAGSSLASALRGTPAEGADAALSAAAKFESAGQGYERAFANHGGVSLPADAVDLPATVAAAFKNDPQGAFNIDNALHAGVAPKTKQAFDVLTSAVTMPDGKLADLEFARRAANDGVMAGGTDAHFSGVLRDKIDDFMSNMEGSQDLVAARNDFRIAKKAQILETRINNANIDASAPNGDLNRSITNQFKALSKSRQMAQFDDDEQAAIERVASGGLPVKTARAIGNIIRGPVGQTVGAVGGGAAGASLGPVGILGGAVEGVRGAKNIGEAINKASLVGAAKRAALAHALVAGGALPDSQIATGTKGLPAALLSYLGPGAAGAYAAMQGSQ